MCLLYLVHSIEIPGELTSPPENTLPSTEGHGSMVTKWLCIVCINNSQELQSDYVDSQKKPPNEIHFPHFNTYICTKTPILVLKLHYFFAYFNCGDVGMWGGCGCGCGCGGWVVVVGTWLYWHNHIMAPMQGKQTWFVWIYIGMYHCSDKPNMAHIISIYFVMVILLLITTQYMPKFHDDIIKWKHFLCYWPYVWGIQHQKCYIQWPLLLTWFNFNPSMDK